VNCNPKPQPCAPRLDGPLARLARVGEGCWIRCLVPVLVSIAIFGAATGSQGAAQPRVDHEAVTLVHDLLLQQPSKELSLDGVLRIRHSDGKRSDIPLLYSVRLEPGRWLSVYQTSATATQGPESLTVVHENERPAQYLFKQISLDGARTNSMMLTGAEAAVSFAGSDFWLTDLGMEFLHWPEQRLVRDAKITMRLGRPCKVLESRNPAPAEGVYGRVVSWIDSELGTLIYAEAYDQQNKHYKVFSLKGFKKISGHWQVKDLELRNDKADSRTRLEFRFETD
jgi:hypothetical protein